MLVSRVNPLYHLSQLLDWSAMSHHIQDWFVPPPSGGYEGHLLKGGLWHLMSMYIYIYEYINIFTYIYININIKIY